MITQKATYKNYFYIIYCLFIILLVPAMAAAKDYYIDPSAGSDGSGTFASPWNTWSGKTISAGNDYRQKCGTTYTSPIGEITGFGTSGNYIIIGAYNADGSHEDGGNETFGQNCSGGSAKPIIKNTLGTGVLIYTDEAESNQYLEINSLQLRDGHSAIYLKSHYNKVRYCYIYNIYWGVRAGINAGTWGGDYSVIEYNYINLNEPVALAPPTYVDAINLDPRADNCTIQYNHIGGYGHAGIQLTSSSDNTIQYNYFFAGSASGENECINHNGFSDDNVFRYNYCHNAGIGHQMMGGSDNEIYGNIYTCNGESRPNKNSGCVQFSSQTSNLPSSNNKFYNNVIYNFNDNKTNQRGIMFYAGPKETADVSGNEIINNIIVKSQTDCIEVVDNNNVIGTNYFYNNICDDYTTNYATIEGSTKTVSQLNSESYASGNLDSDPSLENLVNHQFWPNASGDPVVGNGCDMNDSGSACYDSGYSASETILDSTTDLTASPPSVVTDIQPAEWYIGANAFSMNSHNKIIDPEQEMKGVSGFRVVTKNDVNTN